MKTRKTSSSPARSRKKTSTKSDTKRKSTVDESEITQSVAFRNATFEAAFAAKDLERLRKLLLDAREKINDVPRGPFAETWPYLLAMIRLIRAYHQAEYRDISSSHLRTIVAAIVYFVSPFDVIPDSVPLFGHIDDAMVVRLAVKSVGADLDTFMAWETSKV